jgi:putative ABC transport system permease protein
MGTLLLDLKLALRSLRRAPTYALAAIAALALAIGANTALFSLIEATLLRPYPYPHPERLLILRENVKGFGDSSVAYPNYLDWRAQTGSVFSGMAAFRRDSFNLTSAGDPDRLAARMVGSDFFDALGAHAQIGRTFSGTDDAPGAARTVVLSNALWQKRFASDPRIVGESITLGGDAYTVIGVLPPGFRFLVSSDVFVPIGLWAEQFKDRDSHPGISVLARLKPGVTLEQGRSALNAVAQRLEKEYPRANSGHAVRAQSIQDDQTEDFRGALFILWGAVALVLLIAAANVANLALARAAARAPELAIRAALGAGRGRIARELLTESVLLAVAGGAAGVMLAVWGLDALFPWIPEILRRNAEVRVNGSVLGFTLALSVLTGLMFGVLPALRASRPDLDALLRDGHGTDPRSRRRLRSALVVAEIGLSLMLLIGAGLLLRSFAKAAGVDLGFRPQGVLTMQLSLPPARYPDADSEIRFEREVRRRVGALPGVRSASVAQSMPLFDDNSTGGFWVEGQPRPPPGSDQISSMQYDATPGFLETMGARLLRGRDVRDDDDLRAPVVLIDDALARKLFGTEDPLGHHLSFPPEVVGNLRGPEIVGIYGHMVQYGPGQATSIQAGMILPFAMTAQFAPQWHRGITLAVRADGDLAALLPAVRREVLAIDPELPVYNVKTMEAAVDESLSGRRFSLILLGLFAAVALALAAVGVYGVMSYGVVQRTREIGIRMALGARQEDVLRLVVGDAFRLSVFGIVIGVALAVGLSRVLRGMLFGVSPFDPTAYLGLTVVLVLVALLASWLPARRAAKVDPSVALRAE